MRRTLSETVRISFESSRQPINGYPHSITDLYVNGKRVSPELVTAYNKRISSARTFAWSGIGPRQELTAFAICTEVYGPYLAVEAYFPFYTQHIVNSVYAGDEQEFDLTEINDELNRFDIYDLSLNLYEKNSTDELHTVDGYVGQALSKQFPVEKVVGLHGDDLKERLTKHLNDHLRQIHLPQLPGIEQIELFSCKRGETDKHLIVRGWKVNLPERQSA